ncbi:hypothetical protein KQH61_04095 [bacterium]|nr:hypothetical protein [bacterium]MCB2179084.1 hypothetical protein [bacterium]
MFGIEIKRGIVNQKFLISAAVGFLLLWLGLSDYWLISDAPEYLSRLPAFYNNAHDAFIWAQNTGYWSMLAPLLAVIPYSDSYFNDMHSGFLRSLLMRVSYTKYLLIKYFSTALSGGLALALPLLIFYIYTNIMFSRGFNEDMYNRRLGTNPASFGPFGNMYQIHPDGYIFTLIGIGFLFGATFSIFGLMISLFTKNRYVPLATPFVVFIMVHFFTALFGIPAWSPLSSLTPHWLADGITWIHLVVNLGSIFLLSSLVFFIGTLKKTVRA